LSQKPFLRQKNQENSQRYYRLLTELMPDWEFQKTRLDNLAENLLNDYSWYVLFPS